MCFALVFVCLQSRFEIPLRAHSWAKSRNIHTYVSFAWVVLCAKIWIKTAHEANCLRYDFGDSFSSPSPHEPLSSPQLNITPSWIFDSLIFFTIIHTFLILWGCYLLFASLLAFLYARRIYSYIAVAYMLAAAEDARRMNERTSAHAEVCERVFVAIFLLPSIHTYLW